MGSILNTEYFWTEGFDKKKMVNTVAAIPLKYNSGAKLNIVLDFHVDSHHVKRKVSQITCKPSSMDFFGASYQSPDLPFRLPSSHISVKNIITSEC